MYSWFVKYYDRITIGHVLSNETYFSRILHFKYAQLPKITPNQDNKC